ncbi:unnamed protein product [Blepharisma stoltei]|uniref:Uncharacterized protein n=1 Tax=Blepharisma stoltei TaxID=1481888 RepID=A0AAU9JS29_9CILI|nr:unnamed protein product [Blepharisma stoltei]
MSSLNRSTMLGKEKKNIHLKEPLFWAISGSITFCILFTGILYGCIFSFSCASYFPTISYLATFRSHDRWIVFGITFYSTLIPLLFISVKTKLSAYLTWLTNLIGLAGCFLIIITGVVDEVNGLYFMPLDKAHPFLTLFGYFSFAYWIHSVLKAFESIQLEFSERFWLLKCKKTVMAIHVLFVVTGFQWHFAYTIYSNFLVNEVVEALCEWSLITLALSLPYQISRITNTSISLTWLARK